MSALIDSVLLYSCSKVFWYADFHRLFLPCAPDVLQIYLRSRYGARIDNIHQITSHQIKQNHNVVLMRFTLLLANTEAAENTTE